MHKWNVRKREREREASQPMEREEGQPQAQPRPGRLQKESSAPKCVQRPACPMPGQRERERPLPACLLPASCFEYLESFILKMDERERMTACLTGGTHG